MPSFLPRPPSPPHSLGTFLSVCLSAHLYPSLLTLTSPWGLRPPLPAPLPPALKIPFQNHHPSLRMSWSGGRSFRPQNLQDTEIIQSASWCDRTGDRGPRGEGTCPSSSRLGQNQGLQPCLQHTSLPLPGTGSYLKGACGSLTSSHPWGPTGGRSTPACVYASGRQTPCLYTLAPIQGIRAFPGS